MRASNVIFFVGLAIIASFSGVDAFLPPQLVQSTSKTTLFSKIKSMDDLLAKVPDDKPVLVNFFDANTEKEIASDIVRAKQLLADSCTLVSLKQQDYPELAKLWDAADKSPSMILFKDGRPAGRIYGETHFLEIAAKARRLCGQ